MVSWNAKIKNIETHLVPRLGPRAGAEAGVERAFSHFMNTTLGSRFIAKIIVNTTTNLKKIDEIQVIKIKKYARFLLKSCFGDILDKNAAILSKLSQNGLYTIGVLNALKKLIFHLYYSVFLKDKKIAYFALFLTKKTCLTAYFWTIWTYKTTKKHDYGLL